jgi:hypothetical protein
METSLLFSLTISLMLVPSPPCGIATGTLILCTFGILPSVPNVPLGAENLELKEKGLNF